MGKLFAEVWIGLSTGTLLSIALVPSLTFHRAFERSVFEGVALFAAWLVMRYRGKERA